MLQERLTEVEEIIRNIIGVQIIKTFEKNEACHKRYYSSTCGWFIQGIEI